MRDINDMQAWRESLLARYEAEPERYESIFTLGTLLTLIVDELRAIPREDKQ